MGERGVGVGAQRQDGRAVVPHALPGGLPGGRGVGGGQRPFPRAGVDAGIGVVAVAVADSPAVAVAVEAFVDVAVAVVVDPVAQLSGVRVDRRVAVVAVAAAGGEAVTVGVQVVGQGRLGVGGVPGEAVEVLDARGGQLEAAVVGVRRHGQRVEDLLGGVDGVRRHVGGVREAGQADGPGQGRGAVDVGDLGVRGDRVVVGSRARGQRVRDDAGAAQLAQVAHGQGHVDGAGVALGGQLADGEDRGRLLVVPDVVLGEHPVGTPPLGGVGGAVAVGVRRVVDDVEDRGGDRVTEPVVGAAVGEELAVLRAPPARVVGVGAVVAVGGRPGAVVERQVSTGGDHPLRLTDDRRIDERGLCGHRRPEEEVVHADVGGPAVVQPRLAAAQRAAGDPATGVGLVVGHAVVGQLARVVGLRRRGSQQHGGGDQQGSEALEGPAETHRWLLSAPSLRCCFRGPEGRST